tara:strand:+ start:185 stop:487 length:303 start_codon:yes stop_codon:yes gene_type:complete
MENTQQQQNYDAFIARAGWVNAQPSEEMYKLCHNVSNDMLLMMWTEYLAFTEGLATEVYEIELSKFLEEMGALELVSGFVAYLQGGIDVARAEETKETKE